MSKATTLTPSVVSRSIESRNARAVTLTVTFAGLTGAVLFGSLAGCDQTGSAGSQQTTAAVSTTSSGADSGGIPNTLFGNDQTGKPALLGQRFPYQWHYPQAQHLQHMEGKPAPVLNVTDWQGEESEIKELADGDKITVVDFWATWSQLSVMALSTNIEVADKYADQVNFLGVHDATRGADRMEEVAEEKGVNYPIALDDGGVSAENWNVTTRPTIFVIDRNGIIRGAGMRPDRVEDAIKTLMEEDETGGVVSEANRPWVASDADQYTAETAPKPQPVPAQWQEDNAEAKALIDPQLGYGAPPMIQSDNWMNAEDLSLHQLRGKVVLLRFWGTWCPHCLRSMDEFNAMHDKYYDRGLVIIGVTDERNVSLMDELTEDHNVPYPMCADDGGYMKRAYRLDQFPDYYLIDRWGRLRIVDIPDPYIEPAIEMLLNEKPQ